MRMKFINVRLLTDDFTSAVKFWRDVMQLKLTYQDETIGYAYFETGDSGVELLKRDGYAETLGEVTPQTAPQGYQSVLVFKVDDVDATCKEPVDRGGVLIANAQDRPAWQVRNAALRAHDGYIVEIYTPLSQPGIPTA